VDRAELPELHFITHLNNIASILERGILSNARSGRHNPTSVAMEEIQERRSTRVIPHGGPLPNYACLYLQARNAMLRKILGRHQELAILRIAPDVLDTPGAIIADGNASSDYTRFYPSPDGLQFLDGLLVFARYWTSDDPYDYMHRKRARMAELLVPDKVPAGLIMGAYVSCPQARAELLGVGFALPIVIDHDFFFGKGA
jgi:hypothetical protein